MFGGYSLRRLMERGEGLPGFQQAYVRAGHGHAGVLLVLSLVYYDYLDRATVAEGDRWAACAALAIGVVAQAGGFSLHMALGRPTRPSVGTAVSAAGALLLAAAVLFLAYAWIAEYPG